MHNRNENIFQAAHPTSRNMSEYFLQPGFDALTEVPSIVDCNHQYFNFEILYYFNPLSVWNGFL